MSDESDLRFTTTHEWALPKADTILVGITDDLQDHLSEITQIELPEPDDSTRCEADEEVGLIESLSGAAELHAPVAGAIIAINTELLANPGLINEDPYGNGWIFEMRPDSMDDLEDLLDLMGYEAQLPDTFTLDES